MRTKGKAMLSGNIFCAHCGGRLTTIRYRDHYTRADGSEYSVDQIKYSCYHKSRKLCKCDGQTTYQAGCVDLIGTECGCEKHIEIFKEKGIWIEDGTIVPLPGDIILYNWDCQVQPNDGYSDHIGYVESVSGQMITVMEGNYNEAVARRQIPVGWGQIRGYARPKYTAGVTGQPAKSIEEVAGEVIQGKYGNGGERRKKLCDMGYDPDAVQREVNRQLSQNEVQAECYVVQENDTLSEIAKRFATTYLELAAWNGIADPNMIYVGQKIRIR